MRAILAMAIGTLALCGCGKVAELEPAPGHTLPQKPALAATTPDAEQLLQLPPYAQPDRVDELLRKGEKRKPDRFDLPPPSGEEAPATTEPTPSNNTGPEHPAQPQGSTK